MSNDMGVKEFLESEADAIADNGQTRLLSGLMESGWEFGFGECTEEVLERAKENLRRNFAVIGLTEQFDRTIFFLQEAFGWQDLFYARRNVTSNRPRREDLPKATLDAVTGVSLLDLELYDYARKLFEERVRQRGPSFARKTAWFKLVNNRLNPLISLWRKVRDV